MKVKNMQIVVAFILFIMVVLGLFIFFRADTGGKIPLVAWITKSSQPEQGIIALSLLISSVLWLLISKGVLSEISIFNVKITPDPKKQKVRRYITPIPSPFLAITSVISLAYLLFIPPACAAPNITFNVNMGGETKVYTPQSEADIGQSSSAIVTIKSEESLDEMVCTFQAMGDGLERFNDTSKGCSTTIFFKDKPGTVVVSATVQGKYCSSSSYFSFMLRHQ